MPLDGQKIVNNYEKQKTLLDRVMYLYNIELYINQLNLCRDFL